MGMPKWRSIARVVRTYNVPGEGPTSVKPQGEFRAPRSLVKKALAIREVVEIKERLKTEKPPLPKSKAKTIPTKLGDEVHESGKGDAEPSVAVVESESSSSATEKDKSSRPDDGKGKEKEKSTPGDKRRSRSRGSKK